MSSLSAFANLVPNRNLDMPPPSVAIGGPTASATPSAAATGGPIANQPSTCTISASATMATTSNEGGITGPTNRTATSVVTDSTSSAAAVGPRSIHPAPTEAFNPFANITPSAPSPSSHPRPSAAGAALGDYGRADLLPAGSVPFGQGGGMSAGPSNPVVRDAFNYDGWGGGGMGQRIGGGLMGPPPGARYYPVGPDDGPRRGPMGRGGMGGVGGMNAFGEPDPDHLPPFDPRAVPPPDGMVNGRGPQRMRGGRGGFPGPSPGGQQNYFC